MKRILTAAFVVAPAGAWAAGDYPFFSLYNTDIVVAIGFVLFIGVLIYYKVPTMLIGLLDKRADDIRSDLDAARSLREEAQQLLASYERKSREVEEQSERIVAKAREEAQAAADQAKRDIETSVARRLQAAHDQIASAEKAALRRVRNHAAAVAVAAAGDVIAKHMSDDDAGKMIEDGISQVDALLH
jgi:F-type H+-transporting ATPase subunit b